MSIVFTNRPESRHASFANYLRHVWQQTWSDDLAKKIIAWRYYDRTCEPCVAVDDRLPADDDCIAHIESTIVPYYKDGYPLLIRETGDWYTRPKYRNIGMGIVVIRKMMAQPEPIIVIGGSPMNMEILPNKLGWTIIGEANRFVLPMRARGSLAGWLRKNEGRLDARLTRYVPWLARNYARRHQYEELAQLIPKFVALSRGNRVPPPHVTAEARIVEQFPGDIQHPANGLIKHCDRTTWDWVMAMPRELAIPIGIQFTVGDKIIGFTLAQVEPALKTREGKILHIECAQSDPTIVGWMIFETVRALADQNVDLIRARATSAVTCEAYKKVGFRISQTLPVMWWSRVPIEPPKHIDVGFLRGDDAISFDALRSRTMRGQEQTR